MELSDENTKEVDQSSQEQFIDKTLAESLEEYYKLIDEAADLDTTDSKDIKSSKSEDSVTAPVTVKRTMYRPKSVLRTPIVRRTAVIERSPIVRRTTILPDAEPTAPNSTPATVEKRPAGLPAKIFHRTTIINPRPAVRRQVITHQSSPSCRAGFYWAWTNPKIRSGKCVKDYENNCEEYEYDHGMCNKCFAGFIKTKTQYGDNFCLKQGATMPDLDTLRKGDKAYNRLHRDSSMTWFIWLLIIVVLLVVIGIVTRCICNKRKAESITKGNRFKDLDSAEFYNMGEPNSPF